MALQLGALRNALMVANVSADKVGAAAEEVADYGLRLPRLVVMVQLVIGITVVLVGSQFAIWSRTGEISGQQAALSAKLADTNEALSAKIAEANANFSAKIADTNARFTALEARQGKVEAKLGEISDQIARLKP